MNKTISYLFLLSVLLILVAYYKGTTSITGAFGTAIQQLSYAFTGRDTQGHFAAYPGGA